MPLAKTYINQLLDVLSQPRQLTVSCLGALFQNATTGLAFWAALQAFGYSSNPIETTFVFMLAYALGSAVPTPGGLGGVEAALTFAIRGGRRASGRGPVCHVAASRGVLLATNSAGRSRHEVA